MKSIEVGEAKIQNRGLLSSPKPHVISVTNRTQSGSFTRKRNINEQHQCRQSGEKKERKGTWRKVGWSRDSLGPASPGDVL